jgi:hypothetical protein
MISFFLVAAFFASTILENGANQGWDMKSALATHQDKEKSSLIHTISASVRSLEAQNPIHVGFFGLGESILGEPFYEQIKRAIYSIEDVSKREKIHFHLVVSEAIPLDQKPKGLPTNLFVHALDEALKNETRFLSKAHHKSILAAFNSPGINQIKIPDEGETERDYGNRMVWPMFKYMFLPN